MFPRSLRRGAALRASPRILRRWRVRTLDAVPTWRLSNRCIRPLCYLSLRGGRNLSLPPRPTWPNASGRRQEARFSTATGARCYRESGASSRRTRWHGIRSLSFIGEPPSYGKFFSTQAIEEPARAEDHGLPEDNETVRPAAMKRRRAVQVRHTTRRASSPSERDVAAHSTRWRGAPLGRTNAVTSSAVVHQSRSKRSRRSRLSSI